MAENERRNAEKDLRDGQRELARKQNEYVEDLNLRRNEELGKLQRSLLQEVQALRHARRATTWSSATACCTSNESMDITPQVLSALQARFKTARRLRRRSRRDARQAGDAHAAAAPSRTGAARSPSAATRVAGA